MQIIIIFASLFDSFERWPAQTTRAHTKSGNTACKDAVRIAENSNAQMK